MVAIAVPYAGWVHTLLQWVRQMLALVQVARQESISHRQAVALNPIVSHVHKAATATRPGKAFAICARQTLHLHHRAMMWEIVNATWGIRAQTEASVLRAGQGATNLATGQLHARNAYRANTCQAWGLPKINVKAAA